LILFAFDASPANGVSDDTTDNILAIMSRRWLKRMTVVTAITDRIRKKYNNLRRRRRFLVFELSACFESMGFGSDG